MRTDEHTLLNMIKPKLSGLRAKDRDFINGLLADRENSPFVRLRVSQRQWLHDCARRVEVYPESLRAAG